MRNVLALDANMFAPVPSFLPAPVPASSTAPVPTTATLVTAHSERNYFVEFIEHAVSPHGDFGHLLNFCRSVAALCGPGPDQRKPDLHPEHPQPPAELPATCAPTTLPGPASVLQNACHCNMLAKHIVLCLPACPHMPGFDDSRVSPPPVQTPAIYGLRVGPVPQHNTMALPPASAPWASHANMAPRSDFILHVPPPPQRNHNSNVEILPLPPCTLTRCTHCTCYGANPASHSNTTFYGTLDNSLDLSVSHAPSARPSTGAHAHAPGLDTAVLSTYPPLKRCRQSLQDQPTSMSSSLLSRKHPCTLMPECESVPLPLPAPAAPCAAEPGMP
jgi:hypothetical protein